MFSATLHSDDVKQMAAKLCRNPTLVDLKVGANPFAAAHSYRAPCNRQEHARAGISQR